MKMIKSELELISICSHILLGSDLSLSEKTLIRSNTLLDVTSELINELTNQVQIGSDPLGDAFTAVRSAAVRRSLGAVYTPMTIVNSMVGWLKSQSQPSRIVDPGAGSGRFILAAAHAFPEAKLVAVEMDPLAALILRANIKIIGAQERTTILVSDYRDIKLRKIKGITAFIGNPPYVRHHDIESKWKEWYVSKFADLNIRASALAGLHLHFFLQTRLLSSDGDLGAFITSAEWMDVNYGSSLRNLVIDQLGGLSLHVLDPTVEAFPGTQSTAAICCFRVGESDAPFQVRSVESISTLNGLSTGVDVPRVALRSSSKWSIIIKPPKINSEAGIELGELFRVHRGQVTGANRIWIAGEHAKDLPQTVLIPTITKARELIEAGESLISARELRSIIDIPTDLSEFDAADLKSIKTFLRWAKDQGGDQSYVARHRKAWWSVGLKVPAPILCTYMARRPPQFTVNACGARHINIAHGLYPRTVMPPETIQRIAHWLNSNITVAGGRTYAGGLTKFEPKEMERLLIPKFENFTL
ncbi:Eco57I restriction-modification methylase domain-containing protein [Pseudomonas syringae]|uniref:Eco57I restriction-modification methylase domain-containing protein n=1 Tax=Pseudomonas syringae TaxID=317 RepID=UPI0009B03EFF|nr:N-6 DNA methylase [Pseudomonas syringae]